MLNNSLGLEQKQVLSQRQMQSLNILAYTNQELNDFMLNEYTENPMLESSPEKQDQMIVNLELLYEKGQSYKESVVQREDASFKRKDIRANNENEIEDFLLGQLQRKKFNPTEWKLINDLIQCLDEKGFFTYELSDIEHTFGYPEDMIIKCLDTLKELEPVGIFSKDITECLLKQLEVAGGEDETLLLVVKDYLPYILEGRIGVVTRGLHLTTAKVKEYIRKIGSLDPRPIMNMQKENTQYIVPDILTIRNEDSWEIRINDSWIGEYKLNDYYIRMMHDANDDELRSYFLEKLERARFVMNCIEQRRTTLVKVVRAVMEIQNDYFLRDGLLKPMTLKDVAKRIDMHSSTVSRAIKGKYLQYKKTELIKSLFMTTVSQEEVSVDQMKKRIQTIIYQEEKKHPRSDAQVVKLLEQEGAVISRRTVAKYRVELGIPDSRQRIYLR